LWIYNSIEGDLNESSFQSSTTDIFVSSDSIINTYNTTFDKARDSVADTSILNVFWFVDLTVVDESRNRVEGATVTVTNASGGTVFTGTTNNEGMVPRLALNEYTKNSTAEVFHTPFLFHARKRAGSTRHLSMSTSPWPSSLPSSNQQLPRLLHSPAFLERGIPPECPVQ